jgi:hypothetical protein
VNRKENLDEISRMSTVWEANPSRRKGWCATVRSLPTKASGFRADSVTNSGIGLKAALLLFADYPHAANCFLIHTTQIVLRICSFIWIFAGVFKQGFFTSVFMVAIAFFVIGCFCPLGRDKLLAVEFRRMFWTTLVPR